MKLKLEIYGIDGDDAAELEELLWSLPEISDVSTKWKSRNYLPPGTIQASIDGSIVTCIISYVALKFADEAIKDGYKVFEECFSSG